MKTGAIFIAAWLCFVSASAQTRTEKHISFSGKQSVKLDLEITDSIGIRTWDRDEVYVAASVNINDNKDNDAYQISFPESVSQVVVKANFKKDYFEGKDNCCNNSEITWTVFIPENTPFSVETINGNVTVGGTTKEMKIKTISGFIDLEIPEKKNADLEVSTITGTMYTNLEVPVDKRSSGMPSKIRTSINNGGPEINLSTISGDIFLRKAL